MTANGYRHQHVRDELIEDRQRTARWRTRRRAAFFLVIVGSCLAVDLAAIRLVFQFI